MAGNRKDIMEIKQLIALKLKSWSNRKIATELSISRNTVNQYVRFFNEHNLDYQTLSTYGDAQLYNLFPNDSEVEKQRYEVLCQYFNYFSKELKKPGCTLFTLWEEYIEKHVDGYKRSQFSVHFNTWRQKVKGSCKLDHKVGEKVFIDYTGKKPFFVNRNTGEEIEVEVFVAILPASQYTFVTATRSQNKADFIDAVNKCLYFFEGAPLAIVSDNLKSAVTKTHKYAPKINRSFKDLGLHYNSVIDPARPYSPQDKALVEGAVRLVYQRIFYPLSKHAFFSLEDLNDEIAVLVETYNNYQFSQSTSTRKEEFISLEKQYLQTLPSDQYEIKEYKYAKVHKTGYIYLNEDKHYYSVPYRHIGKQTEVHYTSKMVEVYYKKERIASHQRDYRASKYTTIKDHLSSTHRAYSEWSLGYFQARAERIGEQTRQYITELIEDKPYPEVAYKQAMGILSLRKNYGNERLENACLRGGHHDLRGYHIIENILKKGLDKLPVEVDKNGQIHIPLHKNVRGDYK